MGELNKFNTLKSSANLAIISSDIGQGRRDNFIQIHGEARYLKNQKRGYLVGGIRTPLKYMS